MKPEVTVANIIKTAYPTLPVYNDHVIPQTETGAKIVNLYQTTPYFLADIVTSVNINVNCRAKTRKDSQDLAFQIAALFDRKDKYFDGSRYFYFAEIMQTLPPITDGDYFNTPLTVSVKSNRGILQ